RARRGACTPGCVETRIQAPWNGSGAVMLSASLRASAAGTSPRTVAAGLAEGDDVRHGHRVVYHDAHHFREEKRWSEPVVRPRGAWESICSSAQSVCDSFELDRYRIGRKPMLRHLVPTTIAMLALAACGGGQPARSPAGEPAPGDASSSESAADGGEAEQTSGEDGDEEGNAFALRDSDTAADAHGATPSKIKPTKTEAALKFIVIDKDKGPIQGIVVSLTAPDGKTYYTEETDS